MSVRGPIAGLVVGAVLALSACTGSSPSKGPAAGGTSSPGPTTSSTARVVGDGSAFCDAMIGIGRVGGGATAAEALAANSQLVALLDEAQASTPEDAPPDVDALIDDYRAATDAIAAARGDVDAAYASLPKDVAGRLGASGSHQAAYDFIVGRCGATVTTAKG